MKLAAGFLKHVRNGNKVFNLVCLLPKHCLYKENIIINGHIDTIKDITEAVDEPAILTNNLVKITTKSL